MQAISRVLRGVSAVVVGELAIGTSNVFRQDTSTTATLRYVVGGGGTTCFSGVATYGPDSLHLHAESSYDLGGYEPVSFCVIDVPLVQRFDRNL